MIIQGDCLEKMKEMEDCSIDFIICDPPYGLKFMGKSWDHGIPGIPYWKEALRICKPGSMLAAFGGTRTFHRLTCALEDAGWEIRDCMMYLYGSGFPKSHNNFGIDGYGTALKPAWEPIIICMKPLDGTYAKNVEKWGLGGLNIDECRIECEKFECNQSNSKEFSYQGQKYGIFSERGKKYQSHSKGRWPANLILDEEAAEMLDQQSGISKSPKSGIRKASNEFGQSSGWNQHKNVDTFRQGYNDCGGISRFFYTAKASSSERNAGLEGMQFTENEHRFGKYRCRICNKLKLDHKPCICENPDFERIQTNYNPHPTVKPLSLMRYLIKLLAPQNNPTLLDPFMGSGSTLIAAKQLGINAIGIELNQEYFDIAQKRLEHYKEFDPELPI